MIMSYCLSLAMVRWAAYRVLSLQCATYEADEDAFPAMPLALGSLGLAAVFHANLNHDHFYDTLWMCGVFASAISVLPQLWMMAHRSGKSSALTSHFVAVMAVARVVSGAYMWYVYPVLSVYNVHSSQRWRHYQQHYAGKDWFQSHR